jgi:hypothetical protein
VLEKKQWIFIALGVAIALLVLWAFYKNFEEVDPNAINNPTIVPHDEKQGEPSDPPTQTPKPLKAWTQLSIKELTEVQTGTDAGGCAYDKADHNIYLENRDGQKSFEEQEKSLFSIVEGILRLKSWSMNENGYPSGCLTGHRVEDVGNFYRFGEKLLLMPSSNGDLMESDRDPEFYVASFMGDNKTIPLCFEGEAFKEKIIDLLQALKLSNDCEF